MSETQTVGIPVTYEKPNQFFSRSPFRSWQFVLNTMLLGILCASVLVILWRDWVKVTQHSSVAWVFLLVMLPQNVIYPYWRALIRHRKIHRLYLAGKITGEIAGTTTEEVLSVADDSINEGLRNTTFCFGLFLLALVLWRLR